MMGRDGRGNVGHVQFLLAHHPGVVVIAALDAKPRAHRGQPLGITVADRRDPRAARIGPALHLVDRKELAADQSDPDHGILFQPQGYCGTLVDRRRPRQNRAARPEHEGPTAADCRSRLEG